MKNIIFIAAPAAGKGTISDYLVSNFGYKHISTGDLLRDCIASGSSLGIEIEDKLKHGSLVSDDIVIKLVKDMLVNIKGLPFILDGFPRTLEQARKLDDMFLELNITNVLVVYLQVDLNTLLSRVKGRVVCPKCKKSYNLYNELLKPKMNNICDDCGSMLIKRNDDNQETFVKRYQNFLDNSKDILKFYHDKNSLVTIDGVLPLSAIYQKLISEVNND